MIQFNLLPDVKLQFIKAQRIKRSIITISILLSAAALGLLVLMFFVVNIIQKTHLNNLNENIESISSEIQSNEDVNKILTIQNQLNNLPAVHEDKPSLSKLREYLIAIRPGEKVNEDAQKAVVSFSNIEMDLSEKTMIISGRADSFRWVNELVDTLKFTKYSVDGQEVGDAFTDVVLSDFEANEVDEEGDKLASFEISMSFADDLFDISKDVELIIPNQITTRSVIGRPLFETSLEEDEETETGEESSEEEVIDVQ